MRELMSPIVKSERCLDFHQFSAAREVIGKPGSGDGKHFEKLGPALDPCQGWKTE
jgi:hypothetical protein